MHNPDLKSKTWWLTNFWRKNSPNPKLNNSSRYLKNRPSQDSWSKLPHSLQYLIFRFLVSTNGTSHVICCLKPHLKPSFFRTKLTNESSNSRSYKMMGSNTKLQLSEKETMVTFRILNLSRPIFYRHLGTTYMMAHGWRWLRRENFSCTLVNKTNT